MTNMTSHMAHLLGELRREMNGAVVGSMRYYGREYGLNYGVSIPTIRALGREEAKDHSFAKYLFLQEVRELRLVSLWFAEPSLVEDDLDFWAQGIINSEVAEEAAFVLLNRVKNISKWLYSDSEILQYCAAMAISGFEQIDLHSIKPRLLELLETNPALLPKAVIVLLDRSLRREGNIVSQFLNEMPSNSGCNTIREEIEWRKY